MTAGQKAWAELMTAGFGMMSTGWRASEMMIASGGVVNARMTIMEHAARRPAEGDYAEIAGMVLEKVAALSKVNEALVGQWAAMMADVAGQVQHLGSLMAGGRPASAGDLVALTERWLADSTRMMARAMGTGELALAPIHRQATANARRLG